MIKASIEYLKNEVSSALDLGEIKVSLDSLKGLPDRHGQGILFSFIKAEEEGVSKDLPNFPTDDNKGFNVSPSLSLSLDIMIVFDFDDYGRSLECLTEVSQFFSKNRIFSAENGTSQNEFPGRLTRLIMNPISMDLENLGCIWAMYGSRHYPALFYNVRLIKAEE